MDKIAGNLFFIGLMGVGKTTLGKHIAQKLGRSFYDSDDEICLRTGVSIATIFELEGEQGFRQRESLIIDELTNYKNIVLATGGGAVLNEKNRHNLSERGTVIYLHASPKILLKRTQHDKSRPLLQVENPLAKLEELYNIRDGIYRETAHIIIEADQNYFHITIDKILKKLQQKHH